MMQVPSGESNTANLVGCAWLRDSVDLSKGFTASFTFMYESFVSCFFVLIGYSVDPPSVIANGYGYGFLFGVQPDGDNVCDTNNPSGRN